MLIICSYLFITLAYLLPTSDGLLAQPRVTNPVRDSESAHTTVASQDKCQDVVGFHDCIDLDSVSEGFQDIFEDPCSHDEAHHHDGDSAQDSEKQEAKESLLPKNEAKPEKPKKSTRRARC